MEAHSRIAEDYSFASWGAYAAVEDTAKCPAGNKLNGGCGWDAIFTNECAHPWNDGTTWTGTEWDVANTIDSAEIALCSAACEKYYNDLIPVFEASCDAQKAIIDGAVAGWDWKVIAKAVIQDWGLTYDQFFDAVNYKLDGVFRFGQATQVEPWQGLYAAKLYFNAGQPVLNDLMSAGGEFSFFTSDVKTAVLNWIKNNTPGQNDGGDDGDSGDGSGVDPVLDTGTGEATSSARALYPAIALLLATVIVGIA